MVNIDLLPFFLILKLNIKVTSDVREVKNDLYDRQQTVCLNLLYTKVRIIIYCIVLIFPLFLCWIDLRIWGKEKNFRGIYCCLEVAINVILKPSITTYLPASLIICWYSFIPLLTSWPCPFTIIILYIEKLLLLNLFLLYHNWDI